MKFKVGDRVKQIQNLFPQENPYARIIKIKGNTIHHIHEGTTRETTAPKESFELVTREEIIYE